MESILIYLTKMGCSQFWVCNSVPLCGLFIILSVCFCDCFVDSLKSDLCFECGLCVSIEPSVTIRLWIMLLF